MSTLGEAVVGDLAKRGTEATTEQVDRLLRESGVSASASRGVPVRLRVRRIKVTGTKTYRRTSDEILNTAAAQPPGDAGDSNAVAEGECAEAEGALEQAPINLDWAPSEGVNGIGSEANLRGKTSVLHFIMWALTGRSHLQPDVAKWVARVEAVFTLDDVSLYVTFDVIDGSPAGKVEQDASSGRTTLGEFTDAEDFESLMGSIMLERLRLEAIATFANGRETTHAWPAYAAALTVHADKLDPIVGNETVLGIRLLQMFVGTSWAPIGAQVTTAINGRKFEANQQREQTVAAARVAQGAIAAVEDRVAMLRASLDEFDPADPDVDSVYSLASTATQRAQEAHDLSLQLMTARNQAAQIHSQLHAEQLRRQATVEDAVARRMFNGMTPTMCPRCSSGVPSERYAAEAAEHECSLCASHLDLDSLVEPQAADVTKPEADAVDARDAEETNDAEDEEVADPLDALMEAARDAGADVSRLEHSLATAEGLQADAETQVQANRDRLESARARLRIEMELARAEGALESIQRSTREPVNVAKSLPDSVLESADRLIKQWLKADQDPLLLEVSEQIAQLARAFGSTNITSVALKGSANMDVFKGGAKSGYGGLTDGEKLRIKLATVIALIRLGHRHGVGRHPGLLFVDSPGAEEMPAANLETMLRAMQEAAEETDLQIIVATTHGPMLSTVLPQGSLLVATGTDFVW